MYHRRRFAAVLTMAMLAPGANAAFAASNELQVQPANCSGVTVVGHGWPASKRFFLVARNPSTGRTLGGKPTPIKTSPSGTIEVHLNRNLRGMSTIDVSIWTKQANTLAMTARDRVNTGCGRSERLPMTGSARSIPALLLALLMVVSGTALVLWSHPRAPTV
jgi:hypothetical protein